MSRRAATITATTLISFALLTGLSGERLIAAEGELTQLAQRLTMLRAEVEGIHTQIEDHKIEAQQKTRSLSTQRAELELQLQREELRLKQLQQARQKHIARVQESESSHAQLKPALLAKITHIKAHITRSLPFKQRERLDELEQLNAQLNSGVLSPHKAAARLWQLLEDELRLTRESGLYRQTITLDGEEVLVDVARHGMVAMYFRTNSGAVGKVEREAESWRYVYARGEQEQAQLSLMFESFKKGIRAGFFTLPQAIISPAAGVSP